MFPIFSFWSDPGEFILTWILNKISYNNGCSKHLLFLSHFTCCKKHCNWCCFGQLALDKPENFF